MKLASIAFASFFFLLKAAAQAPPGDYTAQDSLIVRKLLDMNNRQDIPVASVVDLDGSRKFVGLKLSGLKISSLPPEIGKLPIVNFFAGNNSLSVLPVEMDSIFQLRNLELDTNLFIGLPGKLPHVNEVYNIGLRYNRITAITSEDVVRLGLQKLVVLLLGHNKIEYVAPELATQVGPRTLDLRNNSLKTLPIEFVSSRTRLVDVDSNRICHPSDAIAAWITAHNYNGAADWRRTQNCSETAIRPNPAQGVRFIDARQERSFNSLGRKVTPLRAALWWQPLWDRVDRAE